MDPSQNTLAAWISNAYITNDYNNDNIYLQMATNAT